MTDCYALDDAGLQIIASYCSQLVHLYLRRCSRVTDIGVSVRCQLLHATKGVQYQWLQEGYGLWNERAVQAGGKSEIPERCQVWSGLRCWNKVHRALLSQTEVSERPRLRRSVRWLHWDGCQELQALEIIGHRQVWRHRWRIASDCAALSTTAQTQRQVLWRNNGRWNHSDRQQLSAVTAAQHPGLSDQCGSLQNREEIL